MLHICSCFTYNKDVFIYKHVQSGFGVTILFILFTFIFQFQIAMDCNNFQLQEISFYIYLYFFTNFIHFILDYIFVFYENQLLIQCAWFVHFVYLTEMAICLPGWELIQHNFLDKRNMTILENPSMENIFIQRFMAYIARIYFQCSL